MPAPVAVTKPFGSSRSSCARMSAIASACVRSAARRAARAARRGRRPAPSRPGRRSPGSWTPVRLATRSRSAANSARVHAGAGASAVRRRVGAVVEQRRKRPVRVGAQHQPGAWIQCSLDGSSTGDGTARRSSRRVPGPIAAACSAAVGNTRTSTAAPVSTSAGKPRTACPPLVLSTVRGSSSRSSGQVRRPGAFQLAGDRLGDGPADRRGELLLQRLEILAARHLGAVGDSTANVTRRCGGSLSRSKASMGTSTPVQPAQFALHRLQQRSAVRVRSRRARRGRCPARERSCGAGPLAATGSAR